VTEEDTLLGKLKARVRGSVQEAGGSPASGQEVSESPELTEALRQARQQLAQKNRELEALRAELAERDHRRPAGIRPENVVWIFGSGRTGSTWLAAMIEEMKGQTVWFEPRAGSIFELRRFKRYRGDNFILSARYKKTWLQSIQNFVLDGANARFPHAAGPDSYLMVKDPGGSVGAQPLMEAFAESRIVLLIRDPRDVAASWLDAARAGGWQNERKKDLQREETLADTDPNAFVKKHAKAYLRRVGSAKEAYEAHEGRKVLVKYEELRADTFGTMRRMYSELGMPVDEAGLRQVVEKHSWENIPEEKKGEGKFYRKATPGGWREDLTPKQVEMVERITAPLLKEFYPA